MSESKELLTTPLIDPFSWQKDSTHPQEYYDAIKQKFAEERDVRLDYRPEGTAQYNSDLTGALVKYENDTYGGDITPREPINDTVECLFIGGGFSALLTSARLREYGVESIRIVERGADVGGTWYWNRYPGAACDVPSYDYLPLLDEMDYVPKNRFAKGPEIFAHCQAIAKRYDLYDLAVFQTTVTSTVWDEEERMWQLTTNRGDQMKARFVICANGTLAKPKLSKIKGMESFQGHSFHSSRWDYDYTKQDLSGLEDKVVGIIGTGATAVQAIPGLGASAKELYIFQRTPSSIDIRDDCPTDPNWARKLEPGWQAQRQASMRINMDPQLTEELKALKDSIPREERVRRQENANIDYVMRIHTRIDEIVKTRRRLTRSSRGICSCVSARASTMNTCPPITGQTSTSSIPRARASLRSPRKARYSRTSSTNSTSSSMPLVLRCRRLAFTTRSKVSMVSISKRNTAPASVLCSAFTHRAILTYSSSAATRHPFSSI